MPAPMKTWPELNTELRDFHDGIVSRFKALYFMYLSAVEKISQLTKENEELKAKLSTKLKKEMRK